MSMGRLNAHDGPPPTHHRRRSGRGGLREDSGRAALDEARGWLWLYYADRVED